LTVIVVLALADGKTCKLAMGFLLWLPPEPEPAAWTINDLAFARRIFDQDRTTAPIGQHKIRHMVGDRDNAAHVVDQPGFAAMADRVTLEYSDRHS
jgi:hypothetical protein